MPACVADRPRDRGRDRPVLPRVRGHGTGALLVAAQVRAHARRTERRAPDRARQAPRVRGVRALVDRRPVPHGRRGQTADGPGGVAGVRRDRTEVEERVRVRERPALFVGRARPGRAGEGHGRAGRGPAPAGRGGGDRCGRARVAAHRVREPVRDRDRGPHAPGARGSRPVCPAWSREEARRRSPGGWPNAGGRSATT